MIRLGDLLKNLQTSVFTGQGFGRYYPVGSNSAYYRMTYSPDQMIVLHKSPSSPIETKVVCEFCVVNDRELSKMRVRKFLLGKEIYPQNMDITFSMPI